MTQREIIGIVQQLSSLECACGNAKAQSKSFCGPCYHKLPPDLQSALYKRIGKGYEGAHAQSLGVLGFPIPGAPAPEPAVTGA